MHMGLKRYLIGTVLCIACALPAMAQQAGNYAGTTDDGNYVAFTVTEDSGDFTLTNSSVNFAANCKKTGDQASEGWGFYVGKPINNGKVNFVSNDDYYYITAKLTFSGKTKLKGTVESRTAVFQKGSPPTASQYCLSKTQGLTATLQGAPHTPGWAPGMAVAFGRPAGATARMLPELSR